MWFLFTLLAILLFALMNILDSVLVQHYEDRPLVISWVQAMISAPLVLCSGLFFHTESPWALLLLFFGFVTYGGDILFWRMLKIADASSTNFVGVFVAIIMTFTGVYFFHETLSSLQFVGVGIVLIGVGYLSLSEHRSISVEALVLMFCAALFFAPFYIVQKWMLGDGQSFFSTFFWIILGREFGAIIISTFLPFSRRQILLSVPRQPYIFFVWNFLSIIFFLLAMCSMSYAYNVGQASVVSVLSNIHPFLVMGIAWVFTRFFPHIAPRELLTTHSLRVKMVSFSLVFIGLAVLGSSSL